MALFGKRDIETRSTVDVLSMLKQWADVSLRAAGSPSSVDADSAMRHDAVWSCRTKISQDLAMMIPRAYRETGNKTEVDIRRDPRFRVIYDPSGTVDAIDWRYAVIDSWLAHGNAFGLVVATERGWPTQIELFAANEVQEDYDRPGTFQTPAGDQTLWPNGMLWHSRAYPTAGSLLGLSPISLHRESVRGGFAADDFGLQFFDSGGHPTGILSPGNSPTQTQLDELKRMLLDKTHQREPLVLPTGSAYTPIQISPTDSQFIDTQRYSVEKICRIFGEDPVDHGAGVSGSSITYQNRMDADLARLKRRQFWIVKLNRELTKLIPDRLEIRVDALGTLQMSEKELHEHLNARLAAGTITVDEIRTLVGEGPMPEQDAPDEPDTPANIGGQEE